MPRRFGDLEIVEAVPRRTLLTATVLLGILLGTLLSVGRGTGGRHVVMASSPPHFGFTDSTNPGFTTPATTSASFPWLAALAKPHADSVVAALGIVALLYGVIGSLRHSARPASRERLCPRPPRSVARVPGARHRVGRRARLPAENRWRPARVVDQAALTVRKPGPAVRGGRRDPDRSHLARLGLARPA